MAKATVEEIPPRFDPVALNAVRVYRQALGWSQNRLAAEVNKRTGRRKCTGQHVSMWERGEANPGPRYLPHVAALLGVDPVALISMLSQFQPE